MKVKLIIILLLISHTICPQSLYKSTEDYFRISPFKIELKQFINQLMNEPGLTGKKVYKKTDSTLFYLQGIYPAYSPFFFPTTACKIILA